MAFTTRLGDSSDSINSDDFNIRHSDRLTPSSSPLTRMREVDVEAMRRKRKQLKKTLVPSPVSKMNWTRNDELVILAGIVDYEKEMELSYTSDWDAFYRYIKDYIDSNFSKKQLIEKVKNLKRRFRCNQARFNDVKGFTFTNTDDDELFKLSLIIWAKNETQDASNENMVQAKDVSFAEQESKDAPCAEQENMVATFVEEERMSVEIDNGEKEESKEDSVDMENTLISGITFQCLDKNDEKEKNVEDGVDEVCVLQDALEATTMFKKFGKNQQKFLLQNMEKLGAERRKELCDEWKALFFEELRLNIKKQTFSAKLANGGVSP